MNTDSKLQVQTRKLGKTDIEITPIGQGVMQFAGGYGFMRMVYPKLSDQESNAIVKAALDNGINWFDTAESYGKGISESKLSKGLQAADKNDDEIIIATKWMPIMRRASSIKKTIDDRKKYLNPYTIDLHQIHMPFAMSSFQKQFDAMADLLDEGHIRSIGISNFSAKQMIKAHEILADKGHVLASNQVNYSLIKRKIESNGVLDTAKELGISIISWSPLQSGILTGRFHENRDQTESLLLGRKMMSRGGLKKSQKLIDAMGLIAESHEATIAQVALNWLINFHGDTVVAIPGSTKPRQAEQNGQVMNFKLTKTELNDLEELSRDFL